ncbi:MAG: DUF192 domain-containing protein [Myxococcota bacterium]
MAFCALGCGEDAARRVRVESPAGELRLEVFVDEARTAEERMQGLAGRDGLDPGEGLLLIFPAEGEVCIVNEAVPFAIDALFIDGAGTVGAVERHIPAGDSTARCHGATLEVLEVAAGVADPVRVGDQLVRE